MREKSRIFFGFLALEEGYILGMVLTFFLILSIIGVSFLTLATHEGSQAAIHQEKAKRFYFAEGGINKALWIINKVSPSQTTFSDSTVSVVYDSINRKITATSSENDIETTIAIEIEQDHPFRHIYSYKNYSYISDSTSISNIPGAEEKQFNSLPSPDWNYYESIADTILNSGLFSYVSVTNDTLYGIVYVNGNIILSSNAVVYGTVVASGILGVGLLYNCKIYAQPIPPGLTGYPGYYPAIVCKYFNVSLGLFEVPTVYGAIYTSFIFASVGYTSNPQVNLTGPIVSKYITIYGNYILSDMGNDTYYYYPPGFSDYQGEWVYKWGSWTVLN